MSDPDYQSPKTDPRVKGIRFRETNGAKDWSRKILCFTFIPSGLLLIGGVISRLSIDLFALICFAAPILAFIFSLVTAVELSKEKEPIAFVGYWILFVIAHSVLLFIALFVGCGIIGSGSFH